MEIARTFEGWEARIKARGVGRFFAAAFLTVWLAGWTVGEVLVLGILANFGWVLLTGAPLSPRLPSAEAAPLLLVSLFLLVWLTIWTIGGVAAWRQWLRLLAGEDRLVVRPDILRVVHRAGPFRRTIELPRHQLRGLYRQSPRRAVGELYADTPDRSVLLTNLATPGELETLESELTRELGGFSTAPLPDPPDGWCEATAPEGHPVLIPDPARRRRQGILVAALAAGCLIATLTSLRLPQPAVAVLPLAAGLALSWAGLRLLRGRYEWRWDGAGFRLDWRFAGHARPVFSGESLELSLSTDSDSDDWYELAVYDMAPAADAPFRPRRSRRLLRRMRDPFAARRLGEWLARRSGHPLLDRAATPAAPVDLAQVRRRLASAGRLGRWLADRLPAGRK